jgi:hypothetical protein
MARGYSMTYGELPPFPKFKHDVSTRIDPEGDGTKVYWPPGTLYPMELVDDDEVALAEGFGALEEFTPERRRTGRHSGVRGYKGDETTIYDFVTYLSGEWSDGNEKAGDLASSIMGTLGYEWI